MSEIQGELGNDINFFPLTAVHLGKWLSTCHIDNQLFLYVHNKDTLVVLSVHPRSASYGWSPYIIPQIRQRIHRNFGGTSPFARPFERRNFTNSKGNFGRILSALQGDFTGVTAFELKLADLYGFDYMNTLITYGSRIVFELKSVTKYWFPDTENFCRHYKIFQHNINQLYYRPALADDKSIFITRQLYPRNNVIEYDDSKERLTWSIDGTEDNSDNDSNQSNKSFPGYRNVQIDFHSAVMKNETLVVYFDDPLLPYFVKDLIRRPENKAILRMYERGLPSWAVFLPSYGLPYRYWMRKVMTFLIFIVTVTSMLLGFYDLYKNIPALREFLYNVFGNVFIYFEDAVAIRLSVLLGYLVARSQEFWAVLSWLKPLFQFIWDIANTFISPFKLIYPMFQPLLSLAYSLVWFVVFIIVQIKDIIIYTLWSPFELIFGTFTTLRDILIGTWRFLTGFIAFFRSTQNVTNQVHNTVSVFTTIKEFWQNIFRHILKGITSIYNFTVYSSVNLYKYKDSTWLTLEQYYYENTTLIRRRTYQIMGIAFTIIMIRIFMDRMNQDAIKEEL